MPWLLNEDAALKAKFAGLSVTDATAPSRGLQVRYRMPENEVKEPLTYPCVIIDHAGFTVDHEREHRGYAQLPYSPEGQQPLTVDGTGSYAPIDSPYFTQFPIPYNIDYHVTVMARKSLHMMSLRAQLAQFDYLPARFGYLAIPTDGTVRRLDLLGGPEPIEDRDIEGKRLFKDVYMLRVSSEIFWGDLVSASKALGVAITVANMDGSMSEVNTD